VSEVGRYRVHRRIAHGGMAEVFEATAGGEHGFSRRVAIKRMLAAHDADPAFARMFLDEARIASQLHHASIVSVLDYGIVDGQPFQALELVDGMDAHALAKRAAELGVPMPVEIALHICGEIAHALSYAHGAVDGGGHAMGIVHRDVSPGNILISWNGDVKLTDFGIAKAAQREERTEAGVTKGKLVYMSPEQATASTVDARADIFALGCVLHALLRGQSPLSDPDAMKQLFGEGEIRITEELPEDVRRIIVKATRRDLTARYQSASDMAKDLGEAAAKRLRTTPRNALCDWLERLRPEPASGVRKAGKLDDLLDVEIVLGGTDVNGVRRFESTEALDREDLAATDEDDAGPTAAATPRRIEVAEPTAGPPSKKSRAGLLTIAALLVGGVAATGLWLAAREGGDAGAEQTQVATDVAPAPTVPTPAVLPEPVNAEAEAETEVDVDAPAEERIPRMRRRRRMSRPAMRMEVADAPAAMEPAGRGVLLIGGAGAHRAEIFVDGRSRGFAPKRLELPVGAHQIELRGEDGSRLARRSVELSTRHTRSSPERWILP
jgi:serine/threonine-protein kinase